MMTSHEFQPDTLVELLRLRAQQSPDTLAYAFLAAGEVGEEKKVTYRELERQVRAVAAQLKSSVAPGDRVLLLYPQGVDYVIGFLSCLYAGVIGVPVFPPRGKPADMRIQTIADDAQANLALTTDRIHSHFAHRLEHAPHLEKMQWLATDTISADLADSWQSPEIDGNTLAFLQYTSGSTGVPKGVMVSHGNLLHNSEYTAGLWQYDADSVMVTWLPIFHDMGLIFGILQPLYKGFPCYLMSPAAFVQHPFRWLHAISHYRATHSGAPNFAYDLCVQKITTEQRATLDLSSWCMSLNAAEPVRAETFRAFYAAFAPCGLRETTVCHGYGLAEATLIVAGVLKQDSPTYFDAHSGALEQHRALAAEGADQEAQTLVGSGYPGVDGEVAIVHPETLTRCPPEEIGEIWVSSPSVAHGYWQRPDETEETFQAHLSDSEEGSFMRTGDLGFMRAGELFVTGRIKDVIIIRGNNYYPQDIEFTVEQSHPALRAAGHGAAFPVEDGGEEKLVVIQEVERSQLRRLNADEVVGAIRQAISEEHDLQVHAVALLKTATIPRTSSGKIQRSICQTAFLDGALDSVAAWQQASSAEMAALSKPPAVTREDIKTWLLDRFSVKFQIPAGEIDVREPLARYGLDSMTAVGLSGELEEWLGRPFPPTLLYDYPSIDAIMRHVWTRDRQPGKERATSGNAEVGEPIAIVGMGCRFPGAKDIRAFRQLLREGKDAITTMSAARLSDGGFADMDKFRGGFLEDVAAFDASFFGISPREAAQMDPQQRLLLEVCWESLEDAGMAAEGLRGSRTGVFVGISTDDYSCLQLEQGVLSDAYSGTGNAFSIAANRLSYVLDLRGPSMAIDSACSSALVAVHQACLNLRQEECDMALAGGVNLILSPHFTGSLANAGMLAPDGCCKTFDVAANGYVRGEGCGVVVLKRLSNAQRDGDSILALVKGSAVNQDGRSNGLTAPNSLSQQAVVRRALANAGVEAAQIGYLEAHGTGTALGDPIEVNALKEVLLQGRPVGETCWIGSVKTNIGHLAAAAGIAGLIKVALSLQYGEIFPHLNLRELNPLIEIADTPLEIPTRQKSWSASGGTRFAAVSSFGFGGTNAHAILASHIDVDLPDPNPGGDAEVVERSEHLLLLSAKEEPALRALAQQYEAFLETPAEMALGDICFSANAGRTRFPHRLAVVADSSAQVREKLGAFGREENEIDGLQSGGIADRSRPRSAFLFTGQGAQSIGMGRQLYETHPGFRRTLDECDEILRPHLEKPLLEVIFEPSDGQNLLDATAYTQPALFALEYGLARLWQSWGVEPDALMGHSVGEYAAACIAGVFSLEDGLQLIAARGRLMQDQPAGGAMAAVRAPEERVRAAVELHAEVVSMAAVNGPGSSVISGEHRAVEAIVESLRGEGREATFLAVSHAFHSPLMEPVLEPFSRVAETVTYEDPQIDLISNVTGGLATNVATSQYWVDHIRQPVRFASGMEALHELGCGLFVEIGPKPVLLGMGRQCLVSTEEKVWLASLRQRTSDWQQLFQSLGTLYLHGFPIDWCGVDRGYARRRVSLPSYPFQRQRHWIETGEETVGRREIGRLPMTSRKTAFAFSGIGAQWKGMGVELFNSEAVFRRTIKECDCIIGQHADWSLVEELTKGEAESRIEESLIAHPCNFSIQVALVALLRSWGVEPGAVVGHSSGEVAAAHTAGVFDLNDAIHIIWHHCLLMQKVVGKGCMAHISLPWDEVRDLAGDHLDRVTIAAINSPKSTVLSGDVYILEELVAMFESRGSFCRMLEIDIPFHSPKVEPHREEFQRAISDIDIHSSKIPIYSSYRGEMAAAGDFTPSYWSEHIRQQVLFGSAVGAMIQDGYDAFIEIGPHPVLSVSIREVFEEQNRTDSLVVNTLRRGEEEKGELLRGLADLDVAGCLVDWNRLKVADQGRGRAFIDALGARSLQGDIPQPNALHPLWEKRWQSPLHEETVYETRFSAVSPSFLADHVIFENIVVPGASHISMLLGVAELSFGEGSCTLENILFSQALVIPPETARVVQVVAKPGDDAIKLISFAESEEPGSSWVEHVSGRLIDGAPAPEPVLLPAARERCSQQIPGAALYRVMEQLQFRLGADFQWVESIWQGDGEMLCRMKLPRQFTGTEGYQLYPGLIDSCFQPALLAVAGEEQRTFVPFMVEKFLYYRPSTEAAELWCHIAFRESATQDAERLVMDTRLCDETGQVIAEAVGLELRQASRKALRRSLEKDFGDLCYEVTWKPLERNGRRMDDGPGSWLILADGEGLGEELAARLRGEGENCVIVERGSAFAQTGGDHYRVDPGAPGDFARLLRDCFSDSATSESGELPCRGIVHLWSLDTAFDQIIRADDLQEAQLIGCGSALHLVQALAQSGWERIPRLCLVTRGAQLVQTDFHPVQAQQTALWGLGQVISLEYPDLHCLRVDLDPSTGSDAVANLFEAIRGVAKEDRIAYRQDVPYSARLARTDYPVNGQSAPIRKDGSYLITGGLGALGLKVADWLAERGAGHLVLVGRRAPGEAARSEIDRLLQAGIRVTIAQADISEPGDVARVLATVEATEYPLRGVVHAAGVLDDGLLQGQDWDRFSKVMAPKVAGAWNLHDGTRELELDFFVCFSSITALLGAGGQGNYAAANAFMDGLAQHRRSSGLPGLSINWGPWGEVGMIAALDQRDWERWVGQGFGSIEPAQGVAILDRLLAREDSSQAAVLPIDWSLYLQQFRNGASTSFFEAIEPIDKEPKSTLPRGKFLEQLQSTPSAKQREVLVAYVRAQIGKVARLQAVEQIQPRQRLFDLGLDSLMAVELKDSLQSDLGRNLSATLVFDYPTIEALGDHLYGDILGLAQEAQEEPEVYVGEEDLTDLEDLSREEIGALLDEKLSELDL